MSFYTHKKESFSCNASLFPVDIYICRSIYLNYRFKAFYSVLF